MSNRNSMSSSQRNLNFGGMSPSLRSPPSKASLASLPRGGASPLTRQSLKVPNGR